MLHDAEARYRQLRAAVEQKLFLVRAVGGDDHVGSASSTVEEARHARAMPRNAAAHRTSSWGRYANRARTGALPQPLERGRFGHLVEGILGHNDRARPSRGTFVGRSFDPSRFWCRRVSSVSALGLGPRRMTRDVECVRRRSRARSVKDAPSERGLVDAPPARAKARAARNVCPRGGSPWVGGDSPAGQPRSDRLGRARSMQASARGHEAVTVTEARSGADGST